MGSQGHKQGNQGDIIQYVIVQSV